MTPMAIVLMCCDACENWIEVRYAGSTMPPSTQPHPCWCCDGGTMQLKSMRVAA